MQTRREKIKSFHQLEVWQKAHLLVLEIYRHTDCFPQKEVFCLVSQLRRAAISVSSNLAEGFGRASNKEKARFYNISSSSIAEIQNQLLIARDLGYISEADFQILANKTVEIYKMVNSLIRSVKKRTHPIPSS